MQETTRRVPELDALRGVAILLVIAQHYVVGPMTLPTEGWRGLLLLPARLTWSGVDLFFVLSGYLLGSILLANRDAPHYFRAFYVRRAFRILPLYWVLIAMAFYFGRPPLLQYLTFTQNFWMAAAASLGTIPLAVTWSLAIEEQFYLLLPALIRFTRPERLWRALVACMIVAVILRGVLLAMYGGRAIVAAHVLLFTRMDTLAVGVLIAWLGYRKISISTRTLVIIWIASAIGLLALARIADMRQPNPLLLLLYDLVAVFYGATLLLTLRGAVPFLRSRFLAYTGVISYALYLFHQPIALVLGGRHVLAFVILYAVAAASWHFFEKPLIGRGHRYSYG